MDEEETPYDYDNELEYEAEEVDYGSKHYGGYSTADNYENESEGMTETEKAIWAKKKKFAAQEEEELREYMEQRAEEMARLEQELKELKERQAERRLERQEEMERMQEMQRQQEEQRKADEEERKAKVEAEKRKKEAERKKKLAMMAGGGLAGLTGNAGGAVKPNYVLPHKKDGDAPLGPKPEPGQSKEDVAAAKAAYMSKYDSPPSWEDMDQSELKMRIKGMHEQIAKLEAAKYDLEERDKVQNYDLKELKERAKQQARQKAIKKGLDPDEYANAKHPPKKAVASKFDRQTDRRTYAERRNMYEKCLRMDGKPQVPPPKAIFHGSCRPPEDFGRPAARNEELEALRKNLEPPKYQEAAPIENAKPPVQAVKAGPVPEDDEFDETASKPPASVPPPPTEPEPEPEPAPPAEEPPADEPAAEEEEEEE